MELDIRANAESFEEEIQAFLKRAATDEEGIKLLFSHRNVLFSQLNENFSDFAEMLENYPTYGAMSLVGAVRFDPQIGRFFKPIFEEGASVADSSVADIRGFVKIQDKARSLIDQLIDCDETLFLAILAMLWKVQSMIDLDDDEDGIE